MSGIFQYKYEELFNPTIQALKNLGGSASISEMKTRLAKYSTWPMKKLMIFTKKVEQSLVID